MLPSVRSSFDPLCRFCEPGLRYGLALGMITGLSVCAIADTLPAWAGSGNSN